MAAPEGRGTDTALWEEDRSGSPRPAERRAVSGTGRGPGATGTAGLSIGDSDRSRIKGRGARSSDGARSGRTTVCSRSVRNWTSRTAGRAKSPSDVGDWAEVGHSGPAVSGSCAPARTASTRSKGPASRGRTRATPGRGAAAGVCRASSRSK
ncbi:hypothetical protein [Streptomyces phaeochromogenes]